MRIALLLSAMALLVGQDVFAQSEKGRTRRVGSWNIASFQEKGEFKHCIMVRSETNSAAGFGVIRGKTYLALGLFSKKWKLEKGLTYPVTIVADQQTLEAQARADGPDAVIIDITGKDDFLQALSQARTVQIRTPASTLSIPVERPSQALAGLQTCFTEGAGVASNPFGGAQPPAAQAANPFAAPAPAQQQAQNANPFAPPPGARPAAPAVPAAPPAPAPAPAPAPTPAPPPVAAAPAAPAQPSAADQAYAKFRADCEQDEDADRQIAGCTAVIESSREPQLVQGIAHSNRAFGYSKKGDNTRALAGYSEAIRLYPDYANAHWGRGDIHYERKEWAAAIRDFTSALRIDPKDEYSLLRRAGAYQETRAYDAALRDVQEATKLRADAATYTFEGEIHLARNDPAAAARAFDQALKLEPGLATALEGKKKVEAMTAPPTPERAAAALAVVSAAAKPCQFSPDFVQIASLASASGVDPTALDAEPYARIRKAEEDRVAQGLGGAKDSFCQSVWAEYGAAGTKVRGLLKR